MGVEVVESKLAHVSAETGGEGNSTLKENGKNNQVMGLDEPIKFGSHGVDEPVKGELNKVSEVNFPKDAVDEWPAPKQIYHFFFVKYRSFEDQKLKAKLEQADKELQRKNQQRSQLIEKLRAKKSERAQVISHLKAHGKENKQYQMKIDEKRKEMEPLHHALGQLRGANFGSRDRRSGLCSSEEELNDVIKSLQYRIQHESIPLNEEKQILREIKLLEGTREKVIANAAMRAKIHESMGEKEALQDQVKLIGVNLDGVRKEQQVVRARVKQLEEEKEAIDKEIKSVEEELTALTQKRDQTFENIQLLRKQREEGNSSFYENRSLLNKAKELAAKKDVEALKDLSEIEVNKFISFWSNSKAFREDYERRILPSLDMRQLSRDGRMRNPDEKPLLVVESSTSIEAEIVARASVKHQEKNVKQAKEDSNPPSHPDASSVQIGEKEKNVKQQKEATNKKKGTAVKPTDEKDEEEYYVTEKPKDPPKSKEIDEVRLKEMKREEEIAKAKQAQERKKKQAEKAAAKAALKAQKEAEKKEKEREKRLKKKSSFAAVTATPEFEEQTEAATEVVEPGKVEEAVETHAPPKIKDRKENAMRYKKRSNGPDSLPKSLLKRKKATNYWIWAAPAALAVALLIIVGYKYLL